MNAEVITFLEANDKKEHSETANDYIVPGLPNGGLRRLNEKRYPQLPGQR